MSLSPLWDVYRIYRMPVMMQPAVVPNQVSHGEEDTMAVLYFALTLAPLGAFFTQCRLGLALGELRDLCQSGSPEGDRLRNAERTCLQTREEALQALAQSEQTFDECETMLKNGGFKNSVEDACLDPGTPSGQAARPHLAARACVPVSQP